MTMKYDAFKRKLIFVRLSVLNLNLNRNGMQKHVSFDRYNLRFVFVRIGIDRKKQFYVC